MRAVGYRKPLPITDPEALIDIDLPDPTPAPRDLLVRVKAVSVNPVDIKVRAKVEPPPGEVRVLGFDAAGVVEAVGSDASLFKPGDEVYYSCIPDISSSSRHAPHHDHGMGTLVP